MTPVNKFGITGSPEFAKAGERISKKKSAALFENGVSDTKDGNIRFSESYL